MNVDHIHLVLNHIPIIGLPIALFFLFFGKKTQNHSLQVYSLTVVAAITLTILPVYFSGEGAEEIVEHLPGISEDLIKEHEEAAEFSLILTLLISLISIIGIYFRKNLSLFNRLVMAVLVVSIITLGSLLYTAYHGGQIRHSQPTHFSLNTKSALTSFPSFGSNPT